MTPKKSLWSAARLNAELAKSDGASLAFMPTAKLSG
jgi:hypothetical protein